MTVTDAVPAGTVTVPALSLTFPAEADAMLARIQHDLFDVGADLCVPGEAGDRLCIIYSGKVGVTKAGHAALKLAVPLWKQAQSRFETANGAEKAAALRETLKTLQFDPR